MCVNRQKGTFIYSLSFEECNTPFENTLKYTTIYYLIYVLSVCMFLSVSRLITEVASLIRILNQKLRSSGKRDVQKPGLI